MSKAPVSSWRFRLLAGAALMIAATGGFAQDDPQGDADAPVAPTGEVPPPAAPAGSTSSSAGPTDEGSEAAPPPSPSAVPDADGSSGSETSSVSSASGSSDVSSSSTGGGTSEGGGSVSFPPPPGPQGKLLNRVTRAPSPAPEAVFGTYRVRIALLRPEFTDLKFYDELYGKEKMYPEIQADWFAFDWWATIGLSLRAGYYKADGKAAQDINKPVDQIQAADVEKDENGPTELTLIPLQALAIAEFTPFRQKWVVLEGWYGWEWLFFQEARTTKEESTNKTSMTKRPSFGSLMQTSTTTSSDGDQSLANRGWKNNMVLGGAVNLLLNPLDEMSARSMRGSMRLGYVYLSPFVEYVQSIDKGASFSRTVMGLGFTFESIY